MSANANDILKAENLHLRANVKQQAEIIAKMEKALNDSQMEVASASRLLWAAAHANGGLQINDESMALTGDPDCELHSHYDSANYRTVIRAGMKEKDDLKTH